MVVRINAPCTRNWVGVNVDVCPAMSQYTVLSIFIKKKLRCATIESLPTYFETLQIFLIFTLNLIHSIVLWFILKHCFKKCVIYPSTVQTDCRLIFPKIFNHDSLTARTHLVRLISNAYTQKQVEEFVYYTLLTTRLIIFRKRSHIKIWTMRKYTRVDEPPTNWHLYGVKWKANWWWKTHNISKISCIVLIVADVFDLWSHRSVLVIQMYCLQVNF